jgi:pimeloyl-ACP methyl ester carboxylesterase
MSTCRVITLMAAAALLTACLGGPRVKVPNLGGLYDRAAMDHDPLRNPVIVIPGILGSRLVDSESGRVVWGAFDRMSVDPARPADAALAALPMRIGGDISSLRDGVVPDGVLDQIHISLAGLPIDLAAYQHILGALGVGGYRDEELGEAGAVDYGDEHYTCFQFPYDWRQDISLSAGELSKFIEERRAYVQQKLELKYGVENPEVHFDIVAHSMGGLVARHCLMYGDATLPADGSLPDVTWAGAEGIDRVVLIGTPSAGSALALDHLVEGINFTRLFPSYGPALLGTFPSIYELLPRSRHGAVVWADTGEPELWREMRWGLADPRQQRLVESMLPGIDDPAVRSAIALDHQRLCLEHADQVQRALDVATTLPEGLELHLFAGDGEETPSRFAVDRDTGHIRLIDHAPGDGTVARSSALMDERLDGKWSRELRSPIPWTRVTFLFSDHLGLTQHPEFVDNLLHLLLETPAP